MSNDRFGRRPSEPRRRAAVVRFEPVADVLVEPNVPCMIMLRPPQ